MDGLNPAERLIDIRRPAFHGRSYAFGTGDTAASDCGSRARVGPGGFQRQSLWSIKVKLCRCLKGSEINTQCHKIVSHSLEKQLTNRSRCAILHTYGDDKKE